MRKLEGASLKDEYSEGNWTPASRSHVKRTATNACDREFVVFADVKTTVPIEPFMTRRFG